MEKTFVYKPQNVCSREMEIVYDPETMTILSYKTVGGCPGNIYGIGQLVKGMKIDEVIARLEGIPCRGSRDGRTSCPDQLSKALHALKAQEA